METHNRASLPFYTYRQMINRHKLCCLGFIFPPILLFYYFLVFGVLLFQYQEENQLFIPEWWNIQEQLFRPGGFCAVIGQTIIQYYRYPMLAVSVYTIIFCLLGFGIYRLLQERSFHIYPGILVCVPCIFLLKASIQSLCLIDTFIGLLLLIASLQPIRYINNPIHLLINNLLSNFLLFLLAGELAVCHAFLVGILTSIRYTKRQRFYGLIYLIPAILYGYFYEYWGIPVPLWEGLKSEEYIESQLSPLFYAYSIWITFTLLLAGCILVTHLLDKLPNTPLFRYSRSILVLLCFIVFGKSQLPDTSDIQNRMIYEWNYLAREEKWQTLIERHQGKEIHNYLSLNYLNMALAKEGLLAEQMFSFDQKGQQSLLAPWNQTFLVSQLLSDIHFMLGDLALSESYAMDCMTQAKRGGSARMMQRLVQISLLRKEYPLAEKYLQILKSLPAYQTWAIQYSDYLVHPENMEKNPELSQKSPGYSYPDQLSTGITLEELWKHYTPAQKTAWEYAGCYYLLGKELGKFQDFLQKSTNKSEKLPRHFEEAWLIITEGKQAEQTYSISQERLTQYKKFQQAATLPNTPNNLSDIYREFGHTYWFYYYFKQVKNKLYKP